MFRELDAYRREFAAIERDAERLLAGLTEQEIEWRWPTFIGPSLTRGLAAPWLPGRSGTAWSETGLSG